VASIQTISPPDASARLLGENEKRKKGNPARRKCLSQIAADRFNDWDRSVIFFASLDSLLKKKKKNPVFKMPDKWLLLFMACSGVYGGK